MIKLPPRDNDGVVIPHDHEEIKNNDEVIRRISEHFIVDDANGQKVISSMAYRASSGKNGGMSVDLKQLIEQNHIDSKVHVTSPRFMGSVLFKVLDLREMAYQVGYNPIPETDLNPNVYHGEVWGSFSKSDIQRLKNFAVWFVPIDNVNLVSTAI